MEARVRPIILSRSEVRDLLDSGQVDVHRKATHPCRLARPGERLWVREDFCCRLDSGQVKVRYTADGDRGEPRFVPAELADDKYETERYFTWQGKYMPRWASRLTVELLDVRIRQAGNQQRLVLSLKRVGDDGVTG